MIAVAAILSRMHTEGVPQDVWPAWSFDHGNPTGAFPDDPRSMIALSRWCSALGVKHRVGHRAVQQAGGRAIEWTVAVRVGDISVHIIATSSARADADTRELVNA